MAAALKSGFRDDGVRILVTRPALPLPFLTPLIHQETEVHLRLLRSDGADVMLRQMQPAA